MGGSILPRPTRLTPSPEGHSNLSCMVLDATFFSDKDAVYSILYVLYRIINTASAYDLGQDLGKLKKKTKWSASNTTIL